MSLNRDCRDGSLLQPDGLDAVRKAYREVFAEHPIAKLAVACATVVKPRVEEYLCGEIAVELERERVFPFRFHALVSGVAIEPCLPRDVIGKIPSQVNGGLRTEVVQRVVSAVYAVVSGERESADIFEVVGERC